MTLFALTRPHHVAGLALALAACSPSAEDTFDDDEQAAWGQVEWTLTGHVHVRDNVFDLGDAGGDFDPDEPHPLKGARVEIAGSLLSSGGFASWGTTTVQSDGSWSFWKSKSSSRRKFKVYVRFDDDSKMAVKKALGVQYKVEVIHTGWTYHDAGDSDLGAFSFDADAQSDGTITTAERRAASIFWAGRYVIDAFDDNDVPFKDKITVRYPAQSLCNPGCANYVEDVIHIRENWFEDYSEHWQMREIVHEMMHFWHWGRVDGAIDMVCSGDLLHTTHEDWERPFVAFAEGFAEFAAVNAMQALFNESSNCGNRTLPFSRPYLAEHDGLASFDDIRHNDNGIRSLLHQLQLGDYHEYDYDTPVDEATCDRYVVREDNMSARRFMRCPAAPELEFWQILSAFKTHSSVGLTDWLENDEGIDEFLDRVEILYPDQLTSDIRSHMEDLGTPDSEEAGRALCAPRHLTRWLRSLP